MSPPNANRTKRPASKRSRDIRCKLITPTSYCPYQEVSNDDDYSSNGETAVLRDDLEMEITAGALVAIARLVVRRAQHTGKYYSSYRQDIARAILLGLEFLIAGDTIRTVVVAPTIKMYWCSD